MAQGSGPAGGGNIKVVVRVRPFNGRELDRGAKCIVEMKNNQTILTLPPDAVEKGPKGTKDAGQKVFAFDKSYWSFNKHDPNYAGQSNLHADLGKPLLDNAFQGYNNCIFAYGQTGSGKSYSMMGYGKDAGIIPSICQDMFTRINAMQKDANVRCTVEVSYLEIYNERVRDLLNPANKGNLKVREHPSTGPYVEDLAKLVVSSFQEIDHLMDEGNKARTVAATNMNETSSRSHAVFTLMLTQKRFDPETKMEMEKAAKISLVDLAGSERANSTGATGARLKEGAEINRSLSTLGRVIAALADLSTGKKKKGAAGQVPYRDSVLTWLLKDSLGGNSMTAMIAAISPADINYDETLSTLRYADSAKRIKNHAVVNEDANARMIRELKEELAMLRGQLGGGSGGMPVGAPGPGGVSMSTGEVYPEGTPLDQQIVSIVQADGSVKKVSKAEIAEQLSQSEKLLSDLNQTWEEKLAHTQAITKEREEALAELGISIEKGFVGLSTPKKMPHLVNMSDDPLLEGCLVYNLKPGFTTVGNVDSSADAQANIRLNGSRILFKHCTFENAMDGTVTVVPEEGAAVMVNGKRVTEPRRLHSGYRIILGDFHIFRFNHPMEVRAERDERSLLRQSLTASQLQALEKGMASPPARGHERNWSKVDADIPETRPASPSARQGRDSDWSFARREAAPAMLGTDQNVAKLTDEELNALFEEVQRVRAERVNRDGEEDVESTASYPTREKYMSSGTMDNFSLDTALTIPSTPKQGEGEGEGEDRLREVREEMQKQLDKQKEEFQHQLQSAEAATTEVEEIKKEKERMEESLAQLKADMQGQLDAQRREFEERMDQIDPLKRPRAKARLSESEIQRAKAVVKHWRNRRYVQMVERVLQNAAMLKEAQIMSHELEAHVVFQFTMVDSGHAMSSSYDMVLNGLPGEGDDGALETAPKPCVGVRVIDYRHHVVRLWSLDKLLHRVRRMRQMYQYLGEPDYAEQLRLDNPFVDACMPQFTLVGEAEVPLKAVFECRVQDFTLDVFSPHTSQAIGIIKLALEPSGARAPTNMLKFNMVLHEMVGFAEREGTDVHAQLSLAGISEEDGVTTTQMIRDFDEGPVRFESVHSMSVPMFAPRDTRLHVAVFARVSSMHLDKLLSWDDMRDAVPVSPRQPKAARISESQFFTEEKHDLLARMQMLELNEDGEYVAVEVTHTGEPDGGTFQLHQGLQRRLAITLTHSSGDALPWDEVASLRVGNIKMQLQPADHATKTPDATRPDVALRLLTEPVFRTNANGTRNLAFSGQWDSSLHNSTLLDRITPEKHRVQMTLSWDIKSTKLAEPMRFSADVFCQMLPRSFVRPTSVFSSLWQNVRVARSATAVFRLQMRPAPVKRASDLWRMDSQHDYVKGQELLAPWTPRRVSLVADYVAARKKKARLVEMGAVQDFLKRIGRGPHQDDRDESSVQPLDSAETDSIAELLRDTPDNSEPPSQETSQLLDGNDDDDDDDDDDNDDDDDDDDEPPTCEYTESQTALLVRCLRLWLRYPDPALKMLSPANTLPPADGSPDTPPVSADAAVGPEFVASVVRVPKNPKVLKAGHLLVPSADATRWVKRFVELRRPYLHVHNATDGDEVAVVSLRNSRVDGQPGILGLLQGNDEQYALGEPSPSPSPSPSTSTSPTPTPTPTPIDGHGTGANAKDSSASTHKRSASGRVLAALWPTYSSSPSPSPAAAKSNGERGGGLARLSERLQAGVFAVYGTDNTWLFAARSERDKFDWILRIDQSRGGAQSSSDRSSVLSR